MAKKPPFPVYIAMKGSKLPETGTYFVVAKDRFYLHKDTGIVRALVEVDKISFLEDIAPEVELRLPKLPPDVICRAKMFFAGVFKKYRSESAVTLHYNEETQQYYLHCPEQTVSYGGVNYDLDDRFEGYKLVGTIHSHCDFNAFHSGTDIGDEEYQDGLHITLGHVNSENFSASGSLVVNGTRFEVALENSALGVRPITHGGAVRDRYVSLEHQNRYRISLSEEEVRHVKETWGAEIVGWINNEVKKQGGFGGWAGQGSGGSTGGGYGYVAGQGWVSKESDIAEANTTESDDDWDAESVLKDNDLWPDHGDDDARDFVETEDPDLADLTVDENPDVEAEEQSALDKEADKILNQATDDGMPQGTDDKSDKTGEAASADNTGTDGSTTKEGKQ